MNPSYQEQLKQILQDAIQSGFDAGADEMNMSHFWQDLDEALAAINTLNAETANGCKQYELAPHMVISVADLRHRFGIKEKEEES